MLLKKSDTVICTCDKYSTLYTHGLLLFPILYIQLQLLYRTITIEKRCLLCDSKNYNPFPAELFPRLLFSWHLAFSRFPYTKDNVKAKLYNCSNTSLKNGTTYSDRSGERCLHREDRARYPLHPPPSSLAANPQVSALHKPFLKYQNMVHCGLASVHNSSPYMESL